MIPRTVARLRGFPATRPASGLRRLSQKAAEFAGSKFFQVAEEVRDAVATGKPVVALETTIYTHGTFSSHKMIHVGGP